MESSALQSPSRHTALLCWCVAGSITAHALLLTWLPGWRAVKETLPPPLTVELREPPPQIVPPQPLPVEAKPALREPVKPPPKPVPRHQEQAAEQPRAAPLAPAAPAAPLLTAPPEAPVSAATPVVPESKPAPPPEPPRAQVAPAATPAPVTPPSYGAAYLHNPLPEYPPVAMRRREQGTVRLRVVVTPEGKPANVTLEVSSGSSSLDSAAARAVQRWTFVPAREGNQPVQGVVIVPWEFKLPKE